MDDIRYSMEKYRLRVEDTTNREEDFPAEIPVCIVSLALHAFLLLYLVEENLSSEEIPNKEEDKLWYS
jgi:hypothetical protein